MTLEVSSQRAAYFIKWSVISSWKFSILSFNIRPHWWLSCNSAVWHGHCAGVLGDGSIVRKSDGVMVESIPLDKRPPAATCTFRATWHLRRSLLECPLLKCHRTTGCWAVTHAGLPNQVVYANWVCLSSAVKGPGSALLHKQNSCTWECQLPPACPSGRPAFDGQIGINLGKMGASVEVTLSLHFKKGETEVPVAWRTGAVGRLDCSPIAPHAILHKLQKALMKTSGGFRSEADTQKMSFPPPFLSLPFCWAT